MSTANQSLRLGVIHYTNVWPVTHFFDQSGLRTPVRLIHQVPTELNEAMLKGEVDIGPISSFSYGEHGRRYRLFPNLSVSSFGQVGSILLFYKKPLERLLTGRIAMTTASATSVNLLKILLAKYYGATPKYEYAFPLLKDMMQQADGALLIGDDAIRESWANKEYGVMDLGQEWKRWTGQSMTFAVWAVRQEAVERNPDGVREIYEALQQGKQRGMEQRSAVIAAAVDRIGGTEPFWSSYFKRLRYDFALEEQNGLQLYYKYAWELGLLQEPVSIQLWSDKSVMRVKE